MAHLEIKHLRMLQMINRTENLTRAAEHLCVTQSALSQQLKDIEEKLETPLFFRTGKKMIPTRVGKKLLAHGRVILDEIDLAEREVAKAVNGDKGELKIGVRCMFCYKWIPGIIARFQDIYPNVAVDISNCTHVEADLFAEKFDLVISALPVREKNVTYTPLFTSELLCVVSSDHPLSGRKHLDLADFEGIDIIALTEKSNNPLYRHFLLPNGIEPRRHMTVAQPEAVVELIGAGLGVGVLPRWYVLPYMAPNKLYGCPLTSRGTTVEWKAVYLKTEKLPDFQQEFIQLIQRQAIAENGKGCLEKQPRSQGRHLAQRLR